MAFRVLVDEDAYAFLHSLDPKSQRIVRDYINTLKENPYPGTGGKEKLRTGKNRTIYRMHIARSFTAIYTIDPHSDIVHIIQILTNRAGTSKIRAYVSHSG